MHNRPTSFFSNTGTTSSIGAEESIPPQSTVRLVWLFLAFALPLVLVAARLVQLQCFLVDDYVTAFETTSETLEPIPSTDGRIYADDGRVLAEDIERYNISVHYRWLEDPPN